MRLKWTILWIATSFLQVNAQELEDILIYGQRNSSEHVILRELQIAPRTPIDRERLRQERNWLLRLDFLKRIDFLTKTGTRPDRQILMIVIRERSPLSFSPSLDLDDRYGLSLGGSVTTYNLRGNRERVRVSGMIGGYQQLGFSWQNPWMGGPLRLFAELRASYKQIDYLYPDWNDPFEEKDIVFQGRIGRQIGRKLRLGIAGGFEKITLSDAAVSMSLNGTDELYRWQMFSEYDTRDWPFYPREGIFLKCAIDRYYLPQNQSLDFLSTDFRAYFPLGHQPILAVQIAGHLSEGFTPVYKRTHLGGSRTVRGFATGEYAGENILFSSLEYRFPWLYERNPSAGLHFGINGVLFMDAGTIWWNRDSFSFKSVRGSAGLGVHLIWDQWVIRVEYGQQGRKWGFISTGTDVKF